MFHIEHKIILTMTVILKDTVPPILEVAELGYAAVAVYSLLYQSAYQDQRFDQRKCVLRMDCGSTTHWTHKGLADKLGRDWNLMRMAVRSETNCVFNEPRKIEFR